MEKRSGHGALFALVAVFFGLVVSSGSAAPTTCSRKFLDSGTVLRRSMLANGLAETPPMGWNSWNHFNCSIDEKMIRETADALVSTGLAKLGYEYVNIDDCCAESSRDDKACGYLVAKKSTFPSGIKALAVFLSEWGFDQRGVNVNDNRYLNCLLGFAAKLDLDWALWTLPGSYYLREGVSGMDETYWVLDYNWCGTRNSSFIQKISALQSPFQRPGLTNVHPHQIIFHPATSLCIVRKSLVEPLQLGSCTKSDEWTYTPQKTLVIKGTYFCLQADGAGKPAKLGIICSGSNSKWEMISDSKMHLSSKLLDGTTVCLDVDSGNNVVTNLCSCLNVDPTCDPRSQWFKIVNSTISS